MEPGRLKFDERKQQEWLSGKGRREGSPFSRTMINSYKERREPADYMCQTLR